MNKLPSRLERQLVAPTLNAGILFLRQSLTALSYKFCHFHRGGVVLVLYFTEKF
ncbi:unknown protein [Microcystis aeruginosa NIES-843]|uniref:Uncharacterized protein n=1 Tax=Microcystis aeruginosa (strain NIES-843 / IAM M-2473) TaxID=449447 RepID=B0JRG5_MICAN|nr:unknown protein [Microcystis aeruginosa NIES-843]